MPQIAVIAELDGTRPSPLTWELLACAEALANGGPAEIVFVLLAPEAPARAVALARDSGRLVLAVDTTALPQQTTESECELLVALCAARRFDYVCLGHTVRGLEIGPGLAVRLGGTCVTAVEGIRWEEKKPFFRRGVWGGKVLAEVAVMQGPTVLTVLPGCLQAPIPKAAGKPRIEVIELAVPKPRVRLLESRAAPAADVGLRRAKVVVAVGRGLGGIEQLDLMRRLAALFPNSALAGSRIACDAGWLNYTHQVGVTGASVAPALYLACGISGAFQHVTGMRGSGFVVAVNTDPRAAIFNVADLGIVEDLKRFVPLLIAALEGEQEV